MPHIFAKIEVNFPQDPRMKKLTPQERWVYICIWCLAVSTRKEQLSPECSTVTYLSYVSNTHHKTVISTVYKAHNMDIPLLKREDNGGLTVYGVTKHHKKLFTLGSDREEKIREEKSRVEKMEGSTSLRVSNKQQPKPKQVVEASNYPSKIWAGYIGRDLTGKEEEDIIKMESDHGRGVVTMSMGKAHFAGRTDGLGYVITCCRNDPASMAKPVDELGRLMSGIGGDE